MTRLTDYKFNRILLLSVGLWPYHRSKFTRLQYIFLYGILSAGVIFPLTSLIILKYTLDYLTKMLSFVSFSIIFIVQYNAFCLNIEAVKKFMMDIQHILNELKDENEIAIVEKYNCVAKRYMIAITAIGICLIFSVIIIQIWSNIDDMDLSMNNSKSHYLIIMEYFINKKKYFYLNLLHNSVICIGTVIMVGIGTLFIIYVEHICGMFKIASYRIEHAINIDILKDITSKNEIFMIKGIICAVDIHRQAMKLFKYFLSTFEIMIFCIMVCVVACFSLNLFHIFQISFQNVNEFILPFLFASTSLLYMFLANYFGQSIIDHNNHVFITVYNVRWYRTPLHIQRMILFLLQRRAKAFSVNVGGIFDASMEGFATLLKVSVSYFTLMHSTR